MAGCTAVLKPSPLTPWTSALLVQAFAGIARRTVLAAGAATVAAATTTPVHVPAAHAAPALPDGVRHTSQEQSIEVPIPPGATSAHVRFHYTGDNGFFRAIDGSRLHAE
ncbi:hypothetical protein [Streptomyces sp. NPDC088730]|uniref:hypothetical protein n=1 Tax=Streptomyces sp. NPDC088730 TaxID=3365877 RepID=UPI00381AB7DC